MCTFNMHANRCEGPEIRSLWGPGVFRLSSYVSFKKSYRHKESTDNGKTHLTLLCINQTYMLMCLIGRDGQPLFFPYSASSGPLFRKSASASLWSATFQNLVVR
jgi:hypothetical protein